MSEHFFGSGAGIVSEGTCERIRTALEAAGVDARLVTFDDPATGPRYWMACHNRGEPFNGDTARRAVAVLEAAGLWPPDNPHTRPYVDTGPGP